MGGKVYTGRALVQFDLSPIEDVAVTNAELCIYPYDCFDPDAMWDYNMRNGPKTVFKVTSTWDEATANWKVPWSSEGGDYDESDPIANIAPDTTVGVWERFNVTETVKQFVADPSSNHGFLISFNDNDRRGIMVYSSQCEEANKDKRPKLIINGDGTGIKGNKKVSQSGIKLYSRGNGVWLDMSQTKESGSVHVFNVNGRKLVSAEVSRHSGKIFVADRLTPGTYFVKYESKNKIEIKKSVLVR